MTRSTEQRILDSVADLDLLCGPKLRSDLLCRLEYGKSPTRFPKYAVERNRIHTVL